MAFVVFVALVRNANVHYGRMTKGRFLTKLTKTTKATKSPDKNPYVQSKPALVIPNAAVDRGRAYPAKKPCETRFAAAGRTAW